MNNLTLKPYNWQVPIDQEHANTAHLTTIIIAVQGDTAMMITNSFSSMRMDEWHVWERHMSVIHGVLSTYLVWVGKNHQQSAALERAREWAWQFYEFDIAAIQSPI